MDWFEVLGLGVSFGMIGQGARVVVGLKKLNDSASGSGASLVDSIEPSRLLISLLIGAIAGALAATATIDTLGNIPLALLMGLAAAGYTGADFIEGFMNRIVPKVRDASVPPAPMIAGGAVG